MIYENLRITQDLIPWVVYIRNSKLIRYLDNKLEKIINDDDFIRYEIEWSKELWIDDNKNGLKRLVEKRLNYKIENELNRVDYGFISKKKRKKLGREWDKERIELYKSDFNRSFEILKS